MREGRSWSRLSAPEHLSLLSLQIGFIPAGLLPASLTPVLATGQVVWSGSARLGSACLPAVSNRHGSKVTGATVPLCSPTYSASELAARHHPLCASGTRAGPSRPAGLCLGSGREDGPGSTTLPRYPAPCCFPAATDCAGCSGSRSQDGGLTKPSALTGSDVGSGADCDWFIGPSGGVCCC